MRYWDQNFAFDPVHTPAGFGYGQAWDSTAINAGQCPAVADPGQWGHGSTVAATAAANNNGNGHCAGVAPKADLIIVSNDLDHPNWTASVVDAVHYIVEQADLLGRPVAINLSLGSYYGSHDGLDPAALMIDQLLAEAPGRVLVCAAGNSGSLPAYHLHTEVGADTSFTWFAYHPNSVLGTGGVYFDLWADTADFNNIGFSVGADKYTGGYAFRGHTPFRTIQSTLGQVVTDTLWSWSGDRLGVVSTYAQLRGGQYNMEVYLVQPDSAGQLYYRFMTTGAGRFDVWSSDLFGTSKMITAIPDSTTFPAIAHYEAPDLAQSIVDSWACSPSVLTVGNYYNQQVYTDVAGAVQDLGGNPGALAATSSVGPTRTGLVKPDVAAPADVTFGAGPFWVLQMMLDLATNKLIDSLDLEVVHDLSGQKGKLHQLMPNETIEVFSAQGSLVLRGQVSSAAVMDTAVKVAKSYVAQTASVVQGEGVLEMMQDLKQKFNTSMLLITHDLGVVAQNCDMVAVIYAGQIVEKGTAEQTVFDPIHPYAKGLMGSIIVPESGLRKVKLTAIPGVPPNLKNPPHGCRFADRCRYVTAECRTHPIEIRQADEEREYRCIFTEDELRKAYQND